MSRPDFVAPDWLADQDAETIQQRMMDELPADIDDTEGGFPYDFTKPTALEKAELLEYFLVETLKIMFPMWAYDEWLDLHAQQLGLKRKAANAASGYLTVTGVAGTVIPEGFLFAVPAAGDTAALEFATKAEATIEEGGTVSVLVEAVVAGTGGNVAADTIVLKAEPITGITGVTNPAPTTGGTAKESDDELWERIDEFCQNSGESFVGNDSDYARWAKAVPGVGTALPIAEWDGPGTVKLILLDSNGAAASQTIIDNVYDYIVSPDDRENRLAPIGATLTVTAPDALTLNYSFTLTLESGYESDDIEDAFDTAVADYYAEAKAEGIVRYTRIGSVLSNIPGVLDYSDLLVNSGTANINIDADEYPMTGTITAS